MASVSYLNKLIFCDWQPADNQSILTHLCSFNFWWKKRSIVSVNFTILHLEHVIDCVSCNLVIIENLYHKKPFHIQTYYPQKSSWPLKFKQMIIKWVVTFNYEQGLTLWTHGPGESKCNSINFFWRSNGLCILQHSSTLPKIVCLPFNSTVAPRVKKNWLWLSLEPALAIATSPLRTKRSLWWNSSCKNKHVNLYYFNLTSTSSHHGNRSNTGAVHKVKL